MSAPLSILVSPVILNTLCHPERSFHPRSGWKRSRRIPYLPAPEPAPQGISTTALSIHNLFSRLLRRFSRLLARFLRQPAHHPAQLRANNLNRMLLLLLPQRRKLAPTIFVFLNPLFREGPILNVCQSPLHGGPSLITHNFLSPRKVAVLSGVRDG